MGRSCNSGVSAHACAGVDAYPITWSAMGGCGCGVMNWGNEAKKSENLRGFGPIFISFNEGNKRGCIGIVSSFGIIGVYLARPILVH